MEKLLIIGLDGASWNIVEPLVKEGRLKNIGRCIANGSRAVLRSTIPYLTPPAWSSIFSGVNPGKHGMFGFASLGQRGKRRIVTARDMHADYVWEMIDEKVIAFNIPMIYPIRKTKNALLIAGFGCPCKESEFVSNKELKEKILRLEPKYDIDVPGMDVMFKANREELFDKIMVDLQAKKKVAEYLLNNTKWKLGIVVFSSTDWAQHFFMREFERASEKSSTKIGRIYRSIDEFIGKVTNFGDIIILSDHGFKTVRRKVFLNSYLKNKGYLKLKREGLIKGLLRKLGLTREKIKSLPFVRPFIGSYYRAVKKLAEKKKNYIVSIIPGKNFKTYDDIDSEKSSAWIFSKEGGVYLNDISITNRVVEDLQKFNCEVGDKIIKRVWKREELYFGKCVSEAPHLIVELEGDYQFEDGIKASYIESIKDDERDGDHDLNGIFICCGKNFVKGNVAEKMDVVDITPIILYYFGYQMPGGLDGKVPNLFSRKIKPKKSVKKRKFESLMMKLKDLKSIQNDTDIFS